MTDTIDGEEVTSAIRPPAIPPQPFGTVTLAGGPPPGAAALEAGTVAAGTAGGAAAGGATMFGDVAMGQAVGAAGTSAYNAAIQAGMSAAEATAAGNAAAQQATQQAMAQQAGGMFGTGYGTGNLGLEGQWAKLADAALEAGVKGGFESGMQGGDIFGGALKGALTSGAKGLGNIGFDALTGDGAPGMLGGWDEGQAYGGTSNFEGAQMSAADQLALMGIGPGGEAVDYDFGANIARTAALDAPMSPEDQLALLQSGAGSLAEMRAGYDLASAPSDVAPAAAPAPAQFTADTAKTALENLQKVFGKLLTGEEESAPQREEGQSEEEYAQEVSDWSIDYLGLDRETMAKAGLEPGSDAYMQYILDQADSIISQLGVDAEFLGSASVEDLQQALRGKTEDEQRQLQRALFVRGQLGTLSSGDRALDPFSGQVEELGPGMFAPAGAAYQRGVARSTEELAGKRGEEARTFLDDLLGRKTDLYGMQKQADLARERANLEQRTRDPRKRRPGDFIQDVLGGDDGFWG